MKITLLSILLFASTIVFGQSLTKNKLEDSIDKYTSLARYYFRFDKDRTKWQTATDKFEAFTEQLHTQQDSLYAIEQRKVLNKKYPEVKLK